MEYRHTFLERSEHMICSREELNTYVQKDMPFYRSMSKREKFLCWLTADPLYKIARYVRLLRFEEYHLNSKRTMWHSVYNLYYQRKKNRLGNQLGFKIPPNCFGPGLMIYHHGEIIVNEDVRVGADCKLHGGNCIGNNGKSNDVPVIGDDLDLGIGAKIIGDVHLGNRVRVGANAVVTKSFEDDDITLVGVPVRRV